MGRVRRLRSTAAFFALAVLASGCGIVSYPGQPGLVTHGYSKIDLEVIDESGTWVYETTYDNRPGQAGVGAIVTKLYPGATVGTSNTEKNAQGVLYRAKAPYNGAQVQAISVPSVKQIMLPTGSKVQFFLTYATSLNEVDDRNQAEEKIFQGPIEALKPLTRAARTALQFRWDLLKAGELQADGSVDYQVSALELDDQKFTPSQPIKITTNTVGNKVIANIGQQLPQQLAAFVEDHFASGFAGIASFHVKGVAKPLQLGLGMHTVKTAAKAGITIIPNAKVADMERVLSKYGSR